MTNRIVGPNGLIPTPDGKGRPPTTEERIQAALNLWQQGRKNEGFATALNAIAFVSQGLAIISTNFLRVAQHEEAMKRELAELREDMKSMSTALAAVTQRLEAVEKGGGKYEQQ